MSWCISQASFYMNFISSEPHVGYASKPRLHQNAVTSLYRAPYETKCPDDGPTGFTLDMKCLW